MTRRKERGRPPYRDVLTPAEWRVVEAIRHGFANRAIAERHQVSLDAVKYHVANVLQKLGLERRSQIRTYRGIRMDSSLASSTAQDKRPGIRQVGQVSRTVLDIEAARRWYGDVLGLEHLYSFGTLAFFACGSLRIFLSQGERTAAESILYFEVDDIASESAALEARGAEFVAAPHLIHRHDDGTEEWMAFFNDNEGRPLALMCRRGPAQPEAETETR
jgi:DNA-binding CsgD family transcriptional regulator/catechol 2,3-dioxygenase-like lactoylglutathione lyase family enzyme